MHSRGPKAFRREGHHFNMNVVCRVEQKIECIIPSEFWRAAAYNKAQQVERGNNINFPNIVFAENPRCMQSTVQYIHHIQTASLMSQAMGAHVG